jgi:hypothetical protein
MFRSGPESQLFRNLTVSRLPSSTEQLSKVPPSTLPTPSPLCLSAPIKMENGEKKKAQRSKRNITRACDFCKKRHLKCDGETECHNCRDRRLSCTYLKADSRSASSSKKPKKYDGKDDKQNSNGSDSDSDTAPTILLSPKTSTIISTTNNSTSISSTNNSSCSAGSSNTITNATESPLLLSAASDSDFQRISPQTLYALTSAVASPPPMSPPPTLASTEPHLAQSMLVTLYIQAFMQYIQPMFFSCNIAPSALLDDWVQSLQPANQDSLKFLKTAMHTNTVLSLGARCCGHGKQSREFMGQARRYLQELSDTTDFEVGKTLVLMTHYYFGNGNIDSASYCNALAYRILRKHLNAAGADEAKIKNVMINLGSKVMADMIGLHKDHDDKQYMLQKAKKWSLPVDIFYLHYHYLKSELVFCNCLSGPRSTERFDYLMSLVHESERALTEVDQAWGIVQMNNIPTGNSSSSIGTLSKSLWLMVYADKAYIFREMGNYTEALKYADICYELTMQSDFKHYCVGAVYSIWRVIKIYLDVQKLDLAKKVFQTLRACEDVFPVVRQMSKLLKETGVVDVSADAADNDLAECVPPAPQHYLNTVLKSTARAIQHHTKEDISSIERELSVDDGEVSTPTETLDLETFLGFPL